MRVSRFTYAVQQFYLVILLSVRFWIELLRGFVLFGTTYAFRKSFCFVRKNSYYTSYKEATKEVKFSFDFINLLVIFLLGFLFLSSLRPVNALTGLGTLVSIIYLLLLLSFICFKSYFEVDSNLKVLRLMFTQLKLVGFVLAMLFLTFLLAGLNSFLVLLFLPGIFFKMIDLVFKNQKGVNNGSYNQ